MDSDRLAALQVVEHFVDEILALMHAAMQAEREACARIADSLPDPEGIAKAIRARGQA